MDSPRADKVAVVDEVRERLGEASASVVTEYRGLTVADLAQLRQSLSAAGGDYKIFKNTLVRLAVAGSEHEGLEGLLTGPTAITFVHGEVTAVAKALRDFARGNPNLVVKGGLLDGKVLSSGEFTTLADLPSREVLLSSLAGAIAAPLRQLASLMQALPRNLAYGLAALADQRREGAPDAGPDAEPAAPEAAAPEAAAPEAAAPEAAAPEAAAPEAAAPAEPEAAVETAEPEAAEAAAPAEPEAAVETAEPEAAAEPGESAEAGTVADGE